MSRRAQPSGITLSAADAALIKVMLRRGDRQHDIAAWFGVNDGRVAEIAVSVGFGEVQAASPADLPPRGPYPKAAQALAAIEALALAKSALADAGNTIRHIAQHR
jgi:hypothetical protein